MKVKFNIVDFFTGICLSIYPVSFLYAENINDVSLSMIIIPSLIIACIYLFIFSILSLMRLNMKLLNNIKLITPIIVFILFFYNLIHKIILSSNNKLSFLGGHRFLLPFFVILLIFIFFKIGFLGQGSKIGRFIFNVLLIINLIPIVQILIYTINSKNIYNDNYNTIKIKTKLPNIYYIILDGYTSNKNLNNFLAYNNSAFTDQLEEMGFKIQENAYSNYDKTIFSLASTLNLGYVNEIKPNNLTLEDISTYLSDNKVSSILKAYGYTYYMFDLGYGTKVKYSKNEFLVKTLSDGVQNSMISRPDNDFFAYFIDNSIFALFPDKYSNFTNKGHALKIKSFFNLLPIIAAKKGAKFVFAHVISPHPPFLFDAKGNYRYVESLDKELWDNNNYVEQLKYINSATVKAIKETLKNDTSENKIIIIQGDHGSRTLKKNKNYSSKEDWIQERYGILNTILITNNDINKYKTINSWTSSSVNTFRIILNNYFKKDLPILPSKKYYTDGEIQPYVFYKINE